MLLISKTQDHTRHHNVFEALEVSDSRFTRKSTMKNEFWPISSTPFPTFWAIPKILLPLTRWEPGKRTSRFSEYWVLTSQKEKTPLSVITLIRGSSSSSDSLVNQRWMWHIMLLMIISFLKRKGKRPQVDYVCPWKTYSNNMFILPLQRRTQTHTHTHIMVLLNCVVGLRWFAGFKKVYLVSYRLHSHS